MRYAPTTGWFPKTRKNLAPETLRIIREVLDKIPRLPISVRKIIEMAADMDIGAKELAEVALTDPVLSSKILTQVNSAYYSLNRKIDDLRVAIVLIGFNAVRNLAIQDRFLQILGEEDDVSLYDRERLWLHSYLVSVCAESFARSDDPRRSGILMTQGILHDIGKFALYVMGTLMRKKGLKLMYSGSDDTSSNLLKWEERVFGVNHTVIGGMLGAKWNLSERVCSALELHHHPSFFDISDIPPAYLDDVCIISVADSLVNRFLGEPVDIPEPQPEFLEALGRKGPVGSLLTVELKAKLAKAGEFVGSLA
jgi:HD-like signal output (HDOD) protein